MCSEEVLLLEIVPRGTNESFEVIFSWSSVVCISEVGLFITIVPRGTIESFEVIFSWSSVVCVSEVGFCSLKLFHVEQSSS